MARVYDSLLSGLSGKIGRLVVVNRYGKEYIRFHPAHLRKAPSQKQQLSQQRMKHAITFMESYKSYACRFFGKRVGGKTRYNQAMTNLLNSLVLDYDNQTITPNYAVIAFSKGNLLPVVGHHISQPDEKSVLISWQDNSNNNPNRATDLLQILLAYNDDYTTYFFQDAAPRSAQSYTLTLPANLQNKTLHLYLAFKSLDNTQASNSVYAGSIS